MKKLTKILATVLTTAIAMSAVVTSASAAAVVDADKLLWNPANTVGTTAGFNGKDASDLVKQVPAGQWRIYGYGATFDNVLADAVTYETQILLTPGASTKFLVWNGSKDTSRTAMSFTGGKILYSNDNDTSSATSEDSGFTYVENTWNKVAIERTATGWNMYFNGELIGTRNAAYAGNGTYTKDFGFDSVSGQIYVDNIHVYKGNYDGSVDVMPASAGTLSFIENTMTVAEAKTIVTDALAGAPGKVHVYTDRVGGTEAADTDKIQKNWYIVVTSQNDDLYRQDGVYVVSSAIDCTDATFADNTVTATVVNNSGTPIASIMMVLVEDGGKVVMSSETATNVTTSQTFTISGIDSLSNAEVFFVESWNDLAPVLESTFDVE